MTSRRSRLRLSATALAALGIGVLTACGSGTTSGSPPSSSSAQPAAAQTAQVCDALLQTDRTASSGPGGESGPPSPDQVKTFAAALRDPLTRARSGAPADLAPHLDQLIAMINQAASTGDGSLVDSSSNTQLAQQIAASEAWVHQNCGFHNVDVKGVDYAFQGIPATLSSGNTSVAFTNASTDEAHEMAVLRTKPGVTITAKQLVALPAAQAMQMVDFIADIQAPAGQTSGVTAVLTPGHYLVVCFIPVHGQQGQPSHAEKGMIAEFTVA